MTLERLRQLREDNPGWDFRTYCGRLWVIHWGTTPAQLRAGCAATIDADDLDGLAAQLREQVERRQAVAG